MNRSRLLMIGGLALAVGLLVSYTVYNQLRSHAANNQQMVQVVVASNDVQIGSKLTEHDVHLAAFPPASVPPGAFNRIAQIKDRGVILPISRGDFVLPDKLADENAGAGLPSLIPQGMRAVSVRVNDVVSVAGFVQPGTRVDVMATGIHGAGGEDQTTTVLENVAVIAVGRSLLDRVTGDTGNAGVITLLVSPGDAQRLTLATQEGRIQLALRNPLDTRKEGLGGTKASSLLPGGGQVAAAPETKPRIHKVVAKAAPPSPPAPFQVEIIKGSKRDEAKFKPDENN